MEINDRLKGVILSFTLLDNDKVTITEDTDLVSDLGYTSINIVQLYMALETEFNIKISNSYFCEENSSKYKYILNLVNTSIGDKYESKS